MIRNYIKSALRNLAKNKWVSLISILGLSVGLATGLLSYFHIRYETDYDMFHSKHERIYRLVTGDIESGEGWVGISAPIPVKLKSDIPEVEDFVRLTKLRRNGKVVVRHENQSFNEEHFFLADQSLFRVFDFPLLRGDADHVFDNPNGIVIAQSQARKLFGAHDPLGQTIIINDLHEFEVSGVMHDIPENSHLALDYVVSFNRLETLIPGTSLEGNWGQYNYYTYLLLRPDANAAFVEQKIQSIRVPLQDNTHSFENLGLQPVTDIHFIHNRGNLKPSYDRKYLYIYAGAALGLILISVFNFINLTTASSSVRIREVGVRKAIGASKGQLMWQFITEASLLCLASLCISVFLLDFVLLPKADAILGMSIHPELLSVPNVIIGVFFTAIIGVLAGGYIAFFITSFSPVQALKSRIKTGSGKSVSVRNILLGCQFLVAITLIGSSLVMTRQLNHISNMQLGLNPDQILNIPLYVRLEKEKRDALKSELLSLDNVNGVSLNNFNPGTVNWNQTVWWEGQTEDESMFIISVDADFFGTMDLKLIEGDASAIREQSRHGTTYVLNAAAREHIGWDAALGRMFSAFGNDGRGAISGVTENFNFQSLHNDVRPCVLVIADIAPTQLYIKLSSTNISQTIAAVQSRVTTLLPGLPLEYTFVDEEFALLYAAEQKAGKVISFYTLICFLLAVFGLYGLLSFEVHERMKEISIRKVLGATIPEILLVLSKNFLKIVVIASVIAIPVAWYLMHHWLANFVYRIDLSWSLFAITVLSILAVTFIVVSIQSLRAVLANPIHALRSE